MTQSCVGAGLNSTYQRIPCDGVQDGTNAASIDIDIVDFFEDISSFKILFAPTYSSSATDKLFRWIRTGRTHDSPNSITGAVNLDNSVYSHLSNNRRFTFCGNGPWIRYASVALQNASNDLGFLSNAIYFPPSVYRGTAPSDEYDFATSDPDNYGIITGNLFPNEPAVIKCTDDRCRKSVCGLLFAAPVTPLNSSADFTVHPLASIGIKVGMDSSKDYQWFVSVQDIQFGTAWSASAGMPASFGFTPAPTQFPLGEATRIEKAVFSWFGPAVVRSTFNDIANEPITSGGRAFAVKTGAELSSGVTFSTCKAPETSTWNCNLTSIGMNLPTAQRSGSQTIASDTDGYCRRRFFMSNPAPYTAMPLTLNYKEVVCGTHWH